MYQCTVPREARACFGSAKFGEGDGKGGPQFLDMPRAGDVGQAAGEKRAGKWPVPAFLAKVCGKPKPSLTEFCWASFLTLSPPFLLHHAATSDSLSIHRKTM